MRAAKPAGAAAGNYSPWSLHDVRRPSAYSLVKLAVLAALIAAAVWFSRFTEIGRQISPQSIREYLKTFPPWLVPLLYMGLYVLATVFLLPVPLLTFIYSLLFRLFPATL